MVLIVSMLCAVVIITQMSLEIWQSRPRGWQVQALVRLTIRLLLAGGALGVLAGPFYGRDLPDVPEMVILLAASIVAVGRFIRMSHLLAGYCPPDWMPVGLSCHDDERKP